MSKTKNHLPVFGVGPMYVLSCLALTIIGLILRKKGYFSAGEVRQGRLVFAVLAGGFLFWGLFLWAKAVIFQKIGKEIQSGKLVTTGIYSIVRNPIYSAFLFIFTGVLLLAGNYFLLPLPVVFWAFLTVLLKQTEEKWLRQKFGKEYTAYCRKVNRVIPWLPRNDKR